ncbi:hypothetical protein AX17_003844 [Amanita inopinata Kibby_2008]|nr:hypothetical protein AX17_003844 [Amanita inopinata Kibby_2008]
MHPQPLPCQLPAHISSIPRAQSAYTRILNFEESAAATHSKPTLLIYARVLGYLILHGPSDTARATVTKEILSCIDEDALAELGKFYFDHFIRPLVFLLTTLRQAKGHTPASSSHPSRESFDVMRDNLTPQIIEAPQNHEDAKMNALIRDNYRCVVTGYIDPKYAESFGSASDVWSKTNCMPIFDESTNMHVTEGSTKIAHTLTLVEPDSIALESLETISEP